MNLDRLPRRRYTAWETPIEKLQALTDMFGVNIYIKRDDLLGGAAGGNKTRKLEFLMADAIEHGADTIITCGAVQSNHCRLTLSACVKEGMECNLVLAESEHRQYNKRAGGNNLLFDLMGAHIYVVQSGGDVKNEMNKLAEELRAQGKKPYIIPMGGSDEIGSLGYADCAREIVKQAKDMDIRIDAIVCASGSAGTQAGLLTGLTALNADIPVIGIGIDRAREAQRKVVYDMCVRVADKMKVKTRPSMEDVIVFDEYVGDGYTLPTKGMNEAVRLLAKKEAIILDPVYTGKAMHGMIDLIQKGYIKQNCNVLFLHTGGMPGLFAYADGLWS